MDSLFAQLLDGHPDAFALVELDGERLRILEVNQGLARRMGRAAREVVGEDLRSLAPPEFHERWLAGAGAALASATSQAVELDDSPTIGRRERATLVPLAGEAGRRPRLLVQIHDETGGVISDECAALESARRRDAELRVLFDDNVDGVYFVSLDEPIVWDAAADKEAVLRWVLDHGHLTRVNRAMGALHGVDAGALLGLPVRAFLPDIEAGLRQLRAAYDAGYIRLANLPTWRRDGTRILVDLDHITIYDPHGRITGQFGIVRDVTARERAAEALREGEARLALALESGDIFYWDLDLESGEMVTDPRLSARLGLGADEVRSTAAAARFIHPDDRELVADGVRATLSGRVDGLHLEHRLVTRAGETLWVVTSGKATGSERDAAPRRVVGTIRDVTSRRSLEQRVLLSERMAALGTLAAGIGHEINNPLTYVVTNLALIDREIARIADGVASPPRLQRELADLRRMVDDARDGALRVARVVHDLRSLTRAEETPAEPVCLPALLGRCLELAAHQIRHRARVVRELAPVPAVAGHEGRLTQLFLNLVVNAAQAIPEGAAESNEIRVTTRCCLKGQVEVEIADTGAGMSREVLARLFDPFFTTKALGEGTGLGLAICHSIVAEAGGAIDVESAPGRGSIFRVRLPVASSSTASAAAPLPAPVAAASGRRLRVLVIDDEPIVGRLVQRVLDDHEVVTETRAEDALARLRAGERFDRIVCDLMMPVMTGIDFYDEVAAIDPEVQARVIFMTGGAFTERARTFLAAVPNPRIEKPFEPAALQRVVLAEPIEAAALRCVGR